MTRETLRILIVAATVIAALTFLYPTYEFYFDPPKNADKLEEVKRKSISLGLDLQGGIHLVLEVDPSQVPEAQRHDVMDRVREIITNRVDQFGVSEPIIHQQGDWRIVVELAGIQDVERAKAIIDRTARLEFKILKSNADLAILLNKVDTHLAAAADDTAKKESGGLFEEVPEEVKHALTALFLPGYREEDLKVSVDNLQTVRQILREVEHLIPDDAEFIWGSKDEDSRDGQKYRRLYYLKKQR
jgi:preprotein translocase subunit SecD